MTLDQGIALSSTIVSVFALLFLAVQVRDGTRQQRSDSLVKILDANRELISLGFSHPELFRVLAGDPKTDPVFSQRYMQLFLNQFSLVHTFLELSMLRGEMRDNLGRDIAEFMAIPAMRQQWEKYGHLYPVSFQTYVNHLLKKR
jgi:hypothetical protein